MTLNLEKEYEGSLEFDCKDIAEKWLRQPHFMRTVPMRRK